MRHYKDVFGSVSFRTSPFLYQIISRISPALEVTRFKKFQQSILGTKEKIIIADIDIRNYAKYVLKEGKDVEKRELLGCLKGKIKLENKSVSLV